MKEICIDVHVHMMADDTAHACELMAQYLLALAKVHRGNGPQDIPDITFKLPVDVLVRPCYPEGMH